MKRRKFIGSTVAGGALIGSVAGPKSAHAWPYQEVDYKMSGYNVFTMSGDVIFDKNLVIEHAVKGKPHKGKVLAAVQAHSDDIPLYAAGLVAKLINEGYEGYLIRTTNEAGSAGGTVGEGMLNAEQHGPDIAKALGMKKAIDLNLKKHQLETINIQELKMRLIFLFRALKVDTVITFDPYNSYEENPDHWMTAYAVMPACWHAGGNTDYPEFGQAGGIRGHSVREKYYHPRSPQGHNVINRIVDISDVIDQKVEANIANYNFGPCGVNGSRLRNRLAKEGKRLPILGDSDRSANFNYIKELMMEDWRILGKEFGFEYAEAYHYVGRDYGENSVEDYVKKNAVPL